MTYFSGFPWSAGLRKLKPSEAECAVGWRGSVPALAPASHSPPGLPSPPPSVASRLEEPFLGKKHFLLFLLIDFQRKKLGFENQKHFLTFPLNYVQRN